RKAIFTIEAIDIVSIYQFAVLGNAILCYTFSMKNEWNAVFLTLIYSLAYISMPLSISGTELALGLLILSLPMALRKGKRESGKLNDFPVIFFVLLLFVPFLSLINSPDPSVSLPWIRRHMFMLIIPVVIITSPLVAAHWKKNIGLFVAASTLAAGYAVLQVFFGETLSRPFFWKGYYVHSNAFFSQSNTLGELLTFGFLAAILATWLARPLWIRLITSSGALLILAGIVSTRTRTPLVVAAVAGALLMIKLFGRRGVIAVILVIILVLAANQSNDRLFWRFRQINQESGGQRAEIWHYGIKAVKSHPVLGIGYGNFRDFLKSHVTHSHRDLVKFNHTHCNLLEAAATTGAAGLIIFLLFWGRVGWDMYKAWLHSRDPVQKAVFLVLLTAFLAFHAEGLTECNLKDAEVALPFYVLVGIFYATRKFARTGQALKQPGKKFS
ncbi:MAG: O-antigen ligase family protein, partial [Holophagae bacterium]|nr:O-antigen ligase family protein [Holophagae bacterium]